MRGGGQWQWRIIWFRSFKSQICKLTNITYNVWDCNKTKLVVGFGMVLIIIIIVISINIILVVIVIITIIIIIIIIVIVVIIVNILSLGVQRIIACRDISWYRQQDTYRDTEIVLRRLFRVIRQYVKYMSKSSDILKESSDIYISISINEKFFRWSQKICLMILSKSSDILQNHSNVWWADGFSWTLPEKDIVIRIVSVKYSQLFLSCC